MSETLLKLTPIGQRLEALGAAIETLDKDIHELHTVLDPVIGPYTTTEDTPSGPDVDPTAKASPYGERINIYVASIYRLSNHVRGLIEAVEV